MIIKNIILTIDLVIIMVPTLLKNSYNQLTLVGTF